MFAYPAGKLRQALTAGQGHGYNGQQRKADRRYDKAQDGYYGVRTCHLSHMYREDQVACAKKQTKQ